MNEEELIYPVLDTLAAIKTFLYHGKEVRARRNELTKEKPSENKFTIIIDALYDITDRNYSP